MMRDNEWRRRPGAGAGRFRRWLIDRSSLTDRVRERCAAFRVELVLQEPRRATRDERFVAGRREQLALVREVFLSCGRARVVFAHSVTPLANLRGARLRRDRPAAAGAVGAALPLHAG